MILKHILLKYFNVLMISLGFCSCMEQVKNREKPTRHPRVASVINQTSIIILGNVQDAGSPHIACKKQCCSSLFVNPDKSRKVVSLGLIDLENQKKYIFESTPDFSEQMKILKEQIPSNKTETPDGIFLTHAHIGHYTGLMYLGKEAMNAHEVPVYAMPKMQDFLKKNGPWSQLVSNNNISIQSLHNQKAIRLTSNIQVIPFTVPHRDEYSETVGYKIIGPNKTALFIPDIDKWDKWNVSIIKILSKVDYAFIDGTFFHGEEINSRDITEIPHPFIKESMSKFKDLNSHEKRKIYFIHFNHTNPVLNPNSKETNEVLDKGFNIANIYDIIKL